TLKSWILARKNSAWSGRLLCPCWAADENSHKKAQKSCAFLWLIFIRSVLLPQHRIQPSVSRTADGKAGAVTEYGGMTVLGVQLQFGEAIDIQNVGAMDANKLGWMEYPFDITKCLLLQISFALRAKAHVIVLGFGVIDLRNRDHMNSCAVTNQNALSPGARRTRSNRQVLDRKKLFGLYSNSRTIQRFTKAVRAERFEQVINGMNLE